MTCPRRRWCRKGLRLQWTLDQKTKPKMVRNYFKTVLDLLNRSDEVLLISPLTWMTPTTAAGEEGGRAEEVEDVSGLEGEGGGEGKLSGQLSMRLK